MAFLIWMEKVGKGGWKGTCTFWGCAWSQVADRYPELLMSEGSGHRWALVGGAGGHGACMTPSFVAERA